MNALNAVLVIDDNEDDCYIIKRSFIKANICGEDQILFSHNGEEGINFLKDYEQSKKKFQDKFPPMLILLDINMPVMDGFSFLECYQRFLDDSKYSSIIILMLTSSPDESDKNKAFSYKAVKDYIIKPFSKDKAEELSKKYFDL